MKPRMRGYIGMATKFKTRNGENYLSTLYSKDYLPARFTTPTNSTSIEGPKDYDQQQQQR